MNSAKILSSKAFKLPFVNKGNKQFKPFLFDKLDAFESKVLESKELIPDAISQIYTKTKVSSLIKAIKDAVTQYYEGFPNRAYGVLSDAMNKHSIAGYLTMGQYPKDQNLFRIRVKEGHFQLEKGELFHVPMEDRGLISTQRYSISGFPSLYLSNSIYVAWEEMIQPKLEKIHAARLVSTRKFKYLDLTTDRYSNKVLKVSGADSNALIAWPLIAACSTMTANRNDSFKPEYIIPQLLLQWVRDSNIVEAIKYSSTHIDINFKNNQGDFHNLVLPVQSFADKGYCSKLIDLFGMSNVISWQQYQASSGGATILNRKGKINPAVDKIEIIKGRGLPYEFSPLSRLEHALF